MRTRIAIESLLALATTLAAGLSVVAPQWIEGLFGVDPDGGSGSAEWGVVAVLAAVSLLAWAMTGRDVRRWRRTQPA